MRIYPYISYYTGYEYINGKYVDKGYYITTINPDGSKSLKKLWDWFHWSI